MSDAQLGRIIRRGLPPTEREAYDAGTPAEREAILDAYTESISQQFRCQHRTIAKSILRSGKRP
jgi:hypothetical protein